MEEYCRSCCVICCAHSATNQITCAVGGRGYPCTQCSEKKERREMPRRHFTHFYLAEEEQRYCMCVPMAPAAVEVLGADLGLAARFRAGSSLETHR